MINKGYLTAETTKESDEQFTPTYAVKPLLEFLDHNLFPTIWCPFDDETSEYVKVFRENGYKVNAWGDSFSDYFMLLEADHGYIVKHKSGQISKSFGNVDISEMTIV